MAGRLTRPLPAGMFAAPPAPAPAPDVRGTGLGQTAAHGFDSGTPDGSGVVETESRA